MEGVNLSAIKGFIFLSFALSISAYASDFDVHDILYKGFLGDNVKGRILGKVYEDSPEILFEDLVVVKRAAILHDYTPLNTRVKGEAAIPVNYNDVKVKWYILGVYHGNDVDFSLSESERIQHIKYNYYEKKFEGISGDEPQIIACSVFIDHAKNVYNSLKEDGVDNYNDSTNPKKIFYLKLKKLIEKLDGDPKYSFCNDGFSLVIERTPLESKTENR